MNWRILYNTVRLEGLFDATCIILVKKIFELHEKSGLKYDKQHGVETNGTVSINGQSFVGANQGSAVYYFPSSSKSIRSAFAYLKRTGVSFRDFTFIDLGCGKGKPLFLASSHPFKKIIGVEAATEFYRCAVRNAASYRSKSQKCHDFEVLHDDILKYQFPDDNLIVFLGNPFIPNSPLYKDLLNTLGETGKRYGKKIYIIYYCPDSHKIFDAHGAMRQVYHYKTWFDSHDWVIYENVL